MWQAEAGRPSAQPTRWGTLAGYSLSSYSPISKMGTKTAILESCLQTEVGHVNSRQSQVVAGCSVPLVPMFQVSFL